MALQTSGAISLNDMHIEVGGSSGTQVSLNDSDIRGLISKGSGAQMSFSEWYGAANVTIPSSAAAINGQSNLKQITVSSYISSGETFQVPTNFWIWSDSNTTPALIIDIPCTIENYGKIIGKGGTGTSSASSGNGGDAIRINSGVSNVTIKNFSGAYIAGGGGGGNSNGGLDGGGAGGGDSQYTNFGGGAGGALNASGTNGHYSGTNAGDGKGGGAGGSGSASDNVTVYNSGLGGGGGRILPGVGGVGPLSYAGSGGSGGNAGGNAGRPSPSYPAGAGGGGWGANGGGQTGGARSGTGGGHAGGKAINDSGVSYTLTNSGTIYGAT